MSNQLLAANIWVIGAFFQAGGDRLIMVGIGMLLLVADIVIQSKEDVDVENVMRLERIAEEHARFEASKSRSEAATTADVGAAVIQPTQSSDHPSKEQPNIGPTEEEMSKDADDYMKAVARGEFKTPKQLIAEVRAAQHGKEQPNAAQDRVVTMTISVGRDGLAVSDVQTHDNSYSDVAIGLSAVRDEINRVFDERKSCPYYPKNEADANRKIIRDSVGAAPAQSAESSTALFTGNPETMKWMKPVMHSAAQSAGGLTHYPTIERLADLSKTTVGYQGPELVAEAVQCWRELMALRSIVPAAQPEAEALADGSTQTIRRNSIHMAISAKMERALLEDSNYLLSDIDGELTAVIAALRRR